MHFEFLNFVLAFVEGFALILSPCILPILPIMLSGTIEGGKKRPLGIITGFTIVFTLFTLLSHYLVTHLGINLDRLRDAAFILIILFGIVMVSSYLTDKFSLLTQKVANFGTSFASGEQEGGGFLSGVLLGGLVSLVWTPCAGPILAAALIQIAVQKTALGSFFALFAFALGSVMPMVIIALLGKKLVRSIGFIKKHTELLRKIFGVIIIVTALALAYISHFRPDLFALLAAPGTAPPAEKTKATTSPTTGLIDELLIPYAAPALAGLGPWINSEPLTLAQLRGKVVLIDFWTYSCINCIRTLPFLLAWDKAYHNQGLVIIGVHTPEFEFEKNADNVRQAVARFGIHYPVALDNQYATWNNYQNSYWPAHYLIDKQGRVVYQHFGEGDYATTEHNIRVLLGLNPMQNMASSGLNAAMPSYDETPETYLGYVRSGTFAGKEAPVTDETANYTFPTQLPRDDWALQGAWLIHGQKIVAMAAGSAIKIHFRAQHVYVVMGNTTHKPLRVKVLLNGQPIGAEGGADVQNSEVTVTAQRLYEVAGFPEVATGEITLIIEDPGVELYTFTFG
ncbi:MAG TPA: cytochrome c biogenesis protein DipZ [Gammaproteobacteria bacterium]|nr:cytochrome c biogenesis protein DipZ [Gammaproteobacteria bacterium]